MRLFKFTGRDGETYGGFRWPLPTVDGQPGEWVDLHPDAKAPLTEADLCSGKVLHLTDAGHLVDWIGEELWEAEADESRGVVSGMDKFGVRRARLVRRVDAWDERTARLFACDCAEDALQSADPSVRDVLAAAIATARRYADGLATREELDAAWAAASAAAWAAASAAASAAAWAAARAAAWDAAWAAASAAAWDAAWAAAWERHNARLLEMLGLEP